MFKGLPTIQHKKCFCGGYNKIHLMASLIKMIICQGESREGRIEMEDFKALAEMILSNKIVTKVVEVDAKADEIDGAIDEFQSLVDLLKGTK